MGIKKICFDPIRSLTFGQISTSYEDVGTPFTVNPRAICLTNTTDVDIVFSDDDQVAEGQIFTPASSQKIWDLTANINPEKDDNAVMAIGTQIVCKSLSGSPSEGGVYLELMYGK